MEKLTIIYGIIVFTGCLFAIIIICALIRDEIDCEPVYQNVMVKMWINGELAVEQLFPQTKEGIEALADTIQSFNNGKWLIEVSTGSKSPSGKYIYQIFWRG